MYNIISLKITGVPKITLFGLCYPRLMPKADPNCVWGGGGGEKRSCEVRKAVNNTSHFKRRDTNEMSISLSLCSITKTKFRY